MTGVDYISTRTIREPVPLATALRAGLAPDGGLYIPTGIPELTEGIPAAQTFQEMAHAILGGWIGDQIPDAALQDIVQSALDFDVPVVELGDSGDLFALELFHGPTLSFKDFGARMLARMLSHFAERESRDLTILVATSGDTGSAVADGFAGVKGVRVVLLYPENQVSDVQERQLVVTRGNVYPLRVAGRFDDCQRMVKEAFSEERLTDVPISTANSINIGRLLPQMIYYVWAQHRLDREDITFCVPSGNLGNLTAGMLAATSGMPCRGFIAAHNRNDFFPEYLAGNDASFRPSVSTLSNAMDVGAPSNFERLESLYSPSVLRRRIRGASVDDAATINRIATAAEEFDYLIDPHTAVGLEAVAREQNRRRDDDDGSAPGGPFVVLSTAHPAKFSDTVGDATGWDVPVPERLSVLEGMPHTFESVDSKTDTLVEYLLSLD